MSNVTVGLVSVNEGETLDDREEGLGGSSTKLGLGLGDWTIRALL